MLKKLIFILVLVCLPWGVEAKEIIKCDTTKFLKCPNKVEISDLVLQKMEVIGQ